MYRIKKERLKSYVLIVLLITSLIQIGILWDYQNHGFPISFIKDIFASKSVINSYSPNAAREQIFKPFRVIASNGNESHWVIGRNSDTYQALWEDARKYLNEMLQSKHLKRIPADEWGKLVVKKSFVFEFKTNIRINLLKWFLDIKDITTDGPTGVYKMLIIPGDYTNSNLYAVYIADGENIYQYIAPFRNGGLSKDGYEKILADIENDKNSKVNEYSMFQEAFGGSRINFSADPDVLLVSRSPKYRSYNSISYSIPQEASDLDEMANIVLGNDKDIYERLVDINDALVFKNSDNIYRVYNNGYLEYNYMSVPEAVDMGDISTAFVNAFKFINRVEKPLAMGADLYLSGIKENEKSFEFTFDYIVGDFPVYVNLKDVGKNEKLSKALIIEANSKRILKCKWIMKEFRQLNEKNSYNVIFADIMFNIDRGSPKKLTINNMGISYVMQTDLEESLDPEWVIEYTDGSIFSVPMPEGQGD